MKIKFRGWYWVVCLPVSMLSCTKFLEKQSDFSVIVPTSIKDLQALLDDSYVMNEKTPGSLEGSADNFFITDAVYDAASDRNSYIWKEYSTIYNTFNDWAYSYNVVYNSNLALERIGEVERKSNNALDWDNVKGSALFFRAYTFLNLAWTYSLAYDAATAQQDLGIALRLNTDYTVPTVRASVAATYRQILADLHEANLLLPDNSLNSYRPSKAASYAATARAWLSMRNYDSAWKYANLSLQIRSSLLDYNSNTVLTGNVSFPPYPYFPEVIFYSKLSTSMSFKATSRGLTDTVLYNSYEANDKRKSVFFRTNGAYQRFKGSYSGHVNDLFSGIAVDEVLLTRAECYARAGKVTEAMQDLNDLLVKRYITNTFTPLTAANKDEALEIILRERQKELIMRGLRWIDIKRLNKEGAGITPTRLVNGQLYVLPPNDNRYAIPIPNAIIEMTGIPQNPQ